MNLQRGVLLAGYGLFPSLSINLFQVNSEIDDTGLPEPSPEMRYQTLFKVIRFLLVVLFVTVVLVI